MSCPYFQPMSYYRRLGIKQGTCQAYRNGRQRICSLHEISNLCTTEQYPQCDAYRTRLKQFVLPRETGFTARQSAKIVGMTLGQIRYLDRTGFLKPSIDVTEKQSGPALYSFIDLLELKVAARLKQAGISLQKIRECIAFLHEHFPDVERPLSERTFITDGKTIFALTDDPSVLLDTLEKGQTVINLDMMEIENEIRGQIIQLFPMKEREIERREDTLDSTSGGF